MILIWWCVLGVGVVEAPASRSYLYFFRLLDCSRHLKDVWAFPNSFPSLTDQNCSTR